MVIIGERINATRAPVRRAIEARDAEFIRAEAAGQIAAGADFIDVNAGGLVGDEAEHLSWLVAVVQAAGEKPLCIDSADPGVIARVLPGVEKAPLINSFTLEPARSAPVLALAAGSGAKVVGLCQSPRGPATTTGEKLDLAGDLVAAAETAGIGRDDLYIDPLVFPLSTDAAAAVQSLEAIEKIRRAFPGVHTVCGLSNISHGLPERGLINRTFLAAARSRGLDSAICDPTDKELARTLVTGSMVMGQDRFCMEYIAAFRSGRLN